MDVTVPPDDNMMEVESAKIGVEKEGVANVDWKVDGKEWPLLKEIMNKQFDMGTSSAALERNFSTMGFIHTELCNRLSTLSVEKLVYVKNNMDVFEESSHDYSYNTYEY